MADPCVFDDCKVWLGGVDLTGACDRADLRVGRAPLNDKRFGDKHEAFYVGILQVDAMAAGFWAAGVGEPDALAATRILPLGSPDRSPWPLTFAPPWAPAEAGGADGNIAYSANVAQSAYRAPRQHGQSIPFEISSKVRSGQGHGVERVTIMLPKLLRTVTATGVARQLGLVGATNKIVSVVHLFAITGGSLTVTVESDDAVGFLSAVTRITHVAMTTAPNRERKELAGPIATDDHWRVVATYTPGTDFTVAVALGIVPA